VRRYPAGKLADSLADIDAPNAYIFVDASGLCRRWHRLGPLAEVTERV
jgi:hypothetical protein